MARITLEDVVKAMAARRPGRAGQLRMIPEPRRGDVPPPPPEHPSREAGALILLYPVDGDLYFVLTRRTETVAMHKGQVSLPGGGREGIETLKDTSLRETSEELGIPAQEIRILGEPLTPLFIPASGFWVTPFVGYWPNPPEFVPEPGEVVELICAPVSTLLDEHLIHNETWEIRGESVMVPFYDIHGHKVWGATAMILSEFAAMLPARAR